MCFKWQHFNTITILYYKKRKKKVYSLSMAKSVSYNGKAVIKKGY